MKVTWQDSKDEIQPFSQLINTLTWLVSHDMTKNIERYMLNIEPVPIEWTLFPAFPLQSIFTLEIYVRYDCKCVCYREKWVFHSEVLQEYNR